MDTSTTQEAKTVVEIKDVTPQEFVDTYGHNGESYNELTSSLGDDIAITKYNIISKTVSFVDTSENKKKEVSKKLEHFWIALDGKKVVEW